MSILYSLLALGFLIFIHELGHFLFALKAKVTVEEFSVGFPPRIFSKKRGETRYSIGAIPVGGYVKMRGQNLDDENPNEPNNYAAKSIKDRFLIIIGGPLANILLPFILMPFAFMGGETHPAFYDEPARIGSITLGSPAANAGMQSGDIITAVNDIQTPDWRSVNQVLSDISDVSRPPALTVRHENGTTEILMPDISAINPESGIGWEPAIPPVIGKIIENSPAEKAGLLPGDLIHSINGAEIKDWTEIMTALNSTGEGQISLTYSRNNALNTVSILPMTGEGDRKLIGISMAQTVRSYSLWEAIKLGTERNLTMIMQTFSFLKSMFTGGVSMENLGGPVMITKVMAGAAESSSSGFILLICFISIQLAVLNLLPLPVLDGGHIVFLIAEWIKGSAVSAKARQISHTIGFALLVSLMLFVTVKDIITIGS